MVELITYAENGLRADQLDEVVLLGANGVTLSIGLEVAEVTDVTVLVDRGTVVLAEGVD